MNITRVVLGATTTTTYCSPDLRRAPNPIFRRRGDDGLRRGWVGGRMAGRRSRKYRGGLPMRKVL